MSAPTSLKTFIAKVLITPPTTSLSESVAVLKTLQSFGRVAVFANPSPDAAEKNDHQQEIDVIYSSSEQLLRACNASPLTVQINQNLPDPAHLDPYNLRGLQSRRQPRPKTFVCKIQQKVEDSTFTGQNILSKAFAPSNESSLYKSLLETDAPPSLVEAFGASASGEGHQESKAIPRFQKDPLDLPDMYLRAAQQSLSQSQSSTTDNNFPPPSVARKTRIRVRAENFKNRSTHNKSLGSK